MLILPNFLNYEVVFTILLAKIQALKKSASKGDKKKRKEVTEEITRLELELNKKHEHEISELKAKVILELYHIFMFYCYLKIVL